ncbi:hypothetical protein AF42_03475 [Citrobacter freundii MGH 56]|nr:hypothetical protein AF42_03475 [Citrobacter freundii MGH 56]
MVTPEKYSMSGQKHMKKESSRQANVFIFEGKTAFFPEITIRPQNALQLQIG